MTRSNWINEKLIIAERNGNIKITSFDSLDKGNPTFSNIKTNLDFDNLLDIYIYQNDIYVTGKKKNW